MIGFRNQREQTDQMVRLRDQLMKLTGDLYLPDTIIGIDATRFIVENHQLEVRLDYKNVDRIEVASLDPRHNTGNYRESDAYKLAEIFGDVTGKHVVFALDYEEGSVYEEIKGIAELEKEMDGYHDSVQREIRGLEKTRRINIKGI